MTRLKILIHFIKGFILQILETINVAGDDIKKDFSTFDFGFEFEFSNRLMLFQIKCEIVLYHSRGIIV